MENHTMTKAKTGFGLLRFPKIDDTPDNYDYDAISKMVDRYMEMGGRYFDTCYTYLNGCSEKAVKECLVQRHPRDSFMLAEKLPGYNCKTYEDNWKFFNEECERCGTDWFDVYMLHWLNGKHYEIAKQCRQFEFLKELKAQGRAKRIGFSYHDNARLLDRILTEQPEVDVVLMQLNYLDWESQGIESRKCYETAVKHGKKVIVMEPVKGGTLANLPEKAEEILREIHPDWSPATWAIRFVQSLPEVEVCLSGMMYINQVEENMRDFAPLNEQELSALKKVVDIINSNTAIACTGCRYCVNHCPKKIPIPDYFKMLNEITRYPNDGWKIKPAYIQLSLNNGKASDCISCGACTRHCPQNLPIPQTMKTVFEKLEKQE